MWTDTVPEIQPCPFCGSDKLSTPVGDASFVRCSSCGALGPDGSSREIGISKWNAASRQPIQMLPRLSFDGLPDGSIVRMETDAAGSIVVAIGAKR